MRYHRGEVWMVDLGMAAKVRPCLVVSSGFDDEDRARVAVVLHTTAERGSRFEVSVPVSFFKEGVFDVQGLRPVGPNVFGRKLGELDTVQLNQIESAIKLWLGLK